MEKEELRTLSWGRFFLGLTLFLGLIFLILAIFLIKTESDLLKSEVLERGKILTDFAAKEVELPVLYGDYVELERIVKSIVEAHKETIAYMVILDRDKIPLTSSSKKPSKIDPNETLVVSSPILKDFGWVEIGFSLKSLKKARILLAFEILFALSLSILISGLGIFLISRRLVIQPTTEIAKMNERLRELTKELDKKVKERTQQLEKSEEEKTIALIREKALKKDVERKAEELQKRLEELEKFHRLTVGRELAMIELKKENERLKEEIERLKKELEKKIS